MAKSAEEEKDYLEIDLVHLFQALWKRVWLIVLSTVLVGALVCWYAMFIITPKYTASAMLYVNNSSLSIGSVSISDLTAAQSLVDTYVVILKSRNVLEDVIEETGVTYSYEDMKNMISAAPVNSTEIFEVKVESASPEEAERIANCICRILPMKISDVVEGSSASIVDYAVVPSQKSSPSVTRYTMIGMIIGLLISAAGVVIMELFDQYIRSEEYLLQTYKDIPVLAVIPDLDEGTSKDRYYYRSRTKGD